MSTTPSPSKRARLPTSSNVPSATASPFPSSSSTRPPNGPRSVGPSGSSNLAPTVVLGMSPVDEFSPANPEQYGITGFTPYNTTSPAYAGTSTQGGMAAASPISAALAHGSRVLSNIQASPMYGTPMIPQHFGRFPHVMAQQQQQQGIQANKQPQTPQAGSPEYLRLALQHLQTSLLSRLEAEAEGYFDAVDSSLALEADTRVVAQKAKAFEAALEAVLGWVEKNGLASIPLLPLPSDPTPPQTADTPAAKTAAPAPAETTSKEDPAKAEGENKDANTANKDEAHTSSTLDQEIIVLQQQAKQLFDQRQRLKEGASIVTSILDS